ncbi:MAG: glycosyltransferase [Chromatiaceae bacterium]|nr:MAG: glycosyltransferase [Chromatiaceae bacterium]
MRTDPVARRPLRVVHLITGLTTGGAEMMLLKLLTATDPARLQGAVIALVAGGELAGPIADLGVPVSDLGLRRGALDARALPRLLRQLRQLRPDLLQTWLYHADLLGALARPWLGQVPLLWNLRQSNLDMASSKRGTRLVVRLCAPLSHWAPRRILCCSEQTRAVHQALGYSGARMTVIPNGFDLARFRPDPDAAADLRRELGLPLATPLIATAARFDPQKDLPNLFAALARLASAVPAVRLLLCGPAQSPDNPVLRGWIRAAGVDGRVHLLGPRQDIARLFAGCDLVVSAAAYGEGFPNIIGEAMACGTPCVVTAVGDSAAIVGATGAVVPPRDATALAAALQRLLQLDTTARAHLGAQARARVAAHYALPAIAARYTEVYEALAAGRRD